MPEQDATVDAAGTDKAEGIAAPAKAAAGRKRRAAEPADATAASSKRTTRGTRA